MICKNPYFPPDGFGFIEEVKECVRERDGEMCYLCGNDEGDFDSRMMVHHVDHNRENNVACNLISICCKCHGMVHRYRDMYTWGERIRFSLRDEYPCPKRCEPQSCLGAYDCECAAGV